MTSIIDPFFHKLVEPVLTEHRNRALFHQSKAWSTPTRFSTFILPLFDYGDNDIIWEENNTLTAELQVLKNAKTAQIILDSLSAGLRERRSMGIHCAIFADKFV